jgi:hypothetical protein
MTIKECILFILNMNENNKLSATEISERIIEEGLYDFRNARYPKKVVGSQLTKMIRNKVNNLFVNKDIRPYLYFIKKDNHGKYN